MGILRLKNSHIKLALDDNIYRRVHRIIGNTRDPDLLISRCRDHAKQLDISVVTKPKSSLKISKFTTTYYKQIRLASDIDDYTLFSKATLWPHELAHVFQWRVVGRSTFAFRYLRARWRWIFEMQAYRVSIEVMRRLGASQSKINKYIANKPQSLRDGYKLGSIRWKDLKSATERVLKTPL